jgi:hypothetical protein
VPRLFGQEYERSVGQIHGRFAWRLQQRGQFAAGLWDDSSSAHARPHYRAIKRFAWVRDEPRSAIENFDGRLYGTPPPPTRSTRELKNRSRRVDCVADGYFFLSVVAMLLIIPGNKPRRLS